MMLNEASRFRFDNLAVAESFLVIYFRIEIFLYVTANIKSIHGKSKGLAVSNRIISQAEERGLNFYFSCV